MEPIPVVDWQLAARTGRALVHPGPSLGAGEVIEVVNDLRRIAAGVEDQVADVTGMRRPDPAEVLVVDRGSWVAAMAESARSLLTGIGSNQDLPEGKLDQLRAKAIAPQAGGAFAVIATRILGQFDPFATPGRLLLVAPNIVLLERRLGANPTDFRTWVCLHEETHRFQFGQAPWLRTHLFGLLAQIIDTDELQFDLFSQDGSGLTLGTPQQRESFDAAIALMSLLEGHADVMMDRAGTRVIPSLNLIRANFEKHRDRRGWSAWLGKLLGMELKRAQYRDGAKFCRTVLQASDLETLNRAFEAPGSLPTLAEIHHPERWLERI